VLSVLAHILVLYAWRMFGTYDFSAPVNLPQSVLIDLAKQIDAVSPAVKTEKREIEESEHLLEDGTVEKNSASREEHDNRPPPSNLEERPSNPKPTDTAFKGAGKVANTTPNSEVSSVNSPDELHQPVIASTKFSPLSAPGDFLSAKNEKLSYMISMLGLPVGSAELEAKNLDGEIWLTLRVKSNSVISNIFPVDNTVETRHIGGRFILTKIKQHEGSFKSDEWFSINLIRKRVSWFDNIGGRSVTKTIPTDEVLDTLSGIYFLRNKQLQIGKTETLYIYDSETYADVPVEILRRETVVLPNFTKVDALVVQPIQKTAGIFRRTGDILIWMTDDAYKVPVKIVTSVALGKVTIELMSAESTPLGEAVKEGEQ
jgi:hypothetical protein